MGKSIISMAIFNSYVKLPEGTNPSCITHKPTGLTLYLLAAPAG